MADNTTESWSGLFSILGVENCTLPRFDPIGAISVAGIKFWCNSADYMAPQSHPDHTGHTDHSDCESY